MERFRGNQTPRKKHLVTHYNLHTMGGDSFINRKGNRNTHTNIYNTCVTYVYTYVLCDVRVYFHFNVQKWWSKQAMHVWYMKLYSFVHTQVFTHSHSHTHWYPPPAIKTSCYRHEWKSYNIIDICWQKAGCLSLV